MTRRSLAGAPVRLENFPHEVGRHCSSSALRSVLAYDGVRLSEAAVFGLGSGLGFFYRHEPHGSPTRRFNGRAPDLEGVFYRLAGVPLRWAGRWRPAWIRAALERGRPLLAQTDIHPIPYYDDAHFSGHGLAVIGYEPAAGGGGEAGIGHLLVADIASEGVSRMPLAAFRDAVAPDHPPLQRPFRYAAAPELRELEPAALAPAAIARTARYLLRPPGPDEGLPAMERLAAELPGWRTLPDGAWAARFGYQAIEKRGTGGGNFRPLYADFLDEAAAWGVPVGAAPAALRRAGAAWSAAGEALKGAAFAADDAERGRELERAAARVAEAAAREREAFGELAALHP